MEKMYVKTPLITVLSCMMGLGSLAAAPQLDYAPTHLRLVKDRLERSIFQARITGRVTDQETGEALAGATVAIKGTTTGVTTGTDGRYTLQIPDGDVILVVSYVGYSNLEVAVKSQTSLDIALTPSSKQLTEMVVVGYGAQQKKEVLGAVATIPTKEISSRNYNNASEVLQGTVAGVTVVNEGGDPTASPTIKVRGIGSLNDESPLLVVDGVIFPGTFSSINPNDIQSVSVLKDASAAIYGARASAGVILVTTKKGTSGQVKVNLNYQQGFQQVARKLKPLNAADFADAMNTATDNAGLSRIPAFNATINPDSRITKTNWMDELFQSGKIYNIDASVSGGTEKSNFFFSGGYRKNEGILINTFSNRYTFRLNSSHQIAKGVKIGENLSYTVNNGQTGNTTSAYTGAIVTAILYPPNATVYRPDGSGRFGGVPEQYAGSYGDLVNPVAYLKRLDNRNPVTNVFINPYLEWEIIKGLNFRSNWGITQIKNDYKQFTVRVTEPGKIFDFNELYQSSYSSTDFLNEQTLNFNRTFGGKHNIDLLVGHTYQYTKAEDFGVKGTGFDNEDPSLRYLKNAKLIQYDRSNVFERGLESYVGRANYNFNEKYLLSAIIRRDGTSKLLQASRWEWYPSLSAGWNISDESFLKNTNWISNLKLRASWGRIGNLAGLSDYAYSLPLAQSMALLGSSPVINYGYAERALSNTNLRWETSQQTNVGLDFGFLQNRLFGSIDVFTKRNQNMLFQEQLPGVAGTPDGRTINAGETENRGIELGLTYQQSLGDFKYDLSANVSFLKNEVTALPAGQELLTIGSRVRNLPNSNFHMIGQPFGAFYGYKTAGIFQSDEEAAAYVNANQTRIQPNAKAGDFRFVDTNGDGVLNDKDRVVLGNVLPTKTFSLNGNASFRGFDLNVFFQGSAGNKVFNSLRNLAMNPGTYPGYNMLEDVKNAWSPTNPGGTIPRLRAGSDPNGNFSRISDFYLEDGSYLRLKSLTLGYTVPATVTKAVKARLYITGQNLFTITKYSGMDPEVGISNFGQDVGKYPLSRVYMFGVNLSF
ncbi:TonB-dependent receptor [Siphonobacter sp. SORGH_AS_0500]|uniref:SusC/RagA family TonB-linked outer membrane protein n=1 Tax=Siphonobacter sp. SORGH_AS_0500 TaxID=1864824 RepID=UPI002862224A|nr:TonB-dependent receptor [Siphonobacter sp. SORGH_AS_0500]MDR6197633.1 TonB-linked SusC/RagA family outer membrane protein [Siphonobacter sp. SORGH_AS_0500]